MSISSKTVSGYFLGFPSSCWVLFWVHCSLCSCVLAVPRASQDLGRLVFIKLGSVFGCYSLTCLSFSASSGDSSPRPVKPRPGHNPALTLATCSSCVCIPFCIVCSAALLLRCPSGIANLLSVPPVCCLYKCYWRLFSCALCLC